MCLLCVMYCVVLDDLLVCVCVLWMYAKSACVLLVTCCVLLSGLSFSCAGVCLTVSVCLCLFFVFVCFFRGVIV